VALLGGESTPERAEFDVTADVGDVAASKAAVVWA